MANYRDMKLHVAGEWRQVGGQRVSDPADGSVLGTVHHATCADMDDIRDCATRTRGMVN